MAANAYSDSELLDRADRVYDERIRPLVETEPNIGKVVVFDVGTADSEVDDNGIEAARRLRARHPDITPIAFKIGYEYVYDFLDRPQVTKP